ncbi:hypothetical protein [Paracoccus binzhouensis]|uniref:hypothetical protein n=1 Tax=Paracoccus binzhouensis TaxID=2796149 RepID=UPI0018EF2260|nr:hypothetical protein [Paracoccus binzhouensis]
MIEVEALPCKHPAVPPAAIAAYPDERRGFGRANLSVFGAAPAMASAPPMTARLAAIAGKGAGAARS